MARSNNKRRAPAQGRKETTTAPPSEMATVSPGNAGDANQGIPTVSSPFAASVPTRVTKISSIASLSSAPAQGGAGSIPGVDLASFGIKKLSKPKAMDKDSKLRCVVVAPQVDVPGTKSCSIVFRCEPNDKSSYTGSWSEKLFWEAVRNRATWKDEIGIADRVLEWADDDVVQKNNKGFAIRLFELPVEVEALPTFATLVKIGDFICNTINALPDNKTTLSIDPDTYLWLTPLGSAVWSDVIGSEAAYLKMIRLCGQPIPGYYERNLAVIHTFFRPESFDPDLARRIYAPFEQIHPELRSELKTADEAERDADPEREEFSGEHHDLGDPSVGATQDEAIYDGN